MWHSVATQVPAMTRNCVQPVSYQPECDTWLPRATNDSRARLHHMTACSQCLSSQSVTRALQPVSYQNVARDCHVLPMIHEPDCITWLRVASIFQARVWHVPCSQWVIRMWHVTATCYQWFASQNATHDCVQPVSLQPECDTCPAASELSECDTWPCYQRGSPCQDLSGNWTTRRPPDDGKETQTAVVWSCLQFIRSSQNHLARHSERGKKTRQTEEEMGRQHQGMDRPGVRHVPEGSGEQEKMEKNGWEIICGDQTTLAVKEQMMMVMMLITVMTRDRVQPMTYWPECDKRLPAANGPNCRQAGSSMWRKGGKGQRESAKLM